MVYDYTWYIWWYIFLHFVDIAGVNSYIIHKEMAEAKNQRPLTQKMFRVLLCDQLSSTSGCGRQKSAVGGATASEAAAVGRATASMPPEMRPLECLPVIVCELSDDPSLKATKGRRRCKLCQALTMWLCRACEVPLCIIPGRCCYTLWHDAKSSQRV